MELAHQRLVLGTNRSNGHLDAILKRPTRRRTAQGRGGWPAPADRRHERRTHAARRGRRARRRRSDETSSGLMSISLIRRCSTTSSLNRTSNRSSAAMSTGALPRTPCSASKIFVCSIMRRASVRVERRQGERAILIDLDQLAARAEQQHGAELRIDAAADDQFVALERRPSAERSRRGSARDRLVP